MGAKIAEIFTGEKTKNNAQHMSDFLQNSELMLQQRAQNFFSEVMNSGSEQKVIKVSKFLEQKYDMRVSVHSGSQIDKDVEEIAGAFSDKKYAKAIGKVIHTVTNALLGRSSGTIEESKGYFIVVGAAGAIMRVDYLVYYKQVISEGLIDLAQNFYLCCYTIASADTRDLTYNDVASAVQANYGSLPVEDKKQLVDIVIKTLGDYEKKL